MSRFEDASWLIVFLIFGSEYQQPLSESMLSIPLQFNALLQKCQASQNASLTTPMDVNLQIYSIRTIALESHKVTLN